MPSEVLINIFYSVENKVNFKYRINDSKINTFLFINILSHKNLIEFIINLLLLLALFEYLLIIYYNYYVEISL